jgi:hypothetical protein
MTIRIFRLWLLMVAIYISCLSGVGYSGDLSSCGLYAQFLWSSADTFESAKSQFNSACNRDYGYNKNDEGACGSYGYERTSYENAKNEFEDARQNVSTFCEVCSDYVSILVRSKRKHKNEIDHLKSIIQQRDREIEYLKKQAKAK